MTFLGPATTISMPQPNALASILIFLHPFLHETLSVAEDHDERQELTMLGKEGLGEQTRTETDVS